MAKIRLKGTHGPHLVFTLACIFCSITYVTSQDQFTFYIDENEDAGTEVGRIPGAQTLEIIGTHLVPLGNLFEVNNNGLIRTKVVLDRETNRTEYYKDDTYTLHLLMNGSGVVLVNIVVRDINDNPPTFPKKVISVNISESAPSSVKIPLGSAVDRDKEPNTIHRFEIIQGNDDQVFNVSGRSSGQQVFLLTLGINGTLDYENDRFYVLIVRVYDNGTPMLYGDLTVNINILDANDNEPIFNQSKYSAMILENATIGKSVLKVFATDQDDGANGQVSFSIDRTDTSDPDFHFRINSETGEINVNKPLDYETNKKYELIVRAKDHGSQPTESTAVVDIEVLNVNENPATISVAYLTKSNTSIIPENAEVGEHVARISVSDPDAPDIYSPNVTVILQGGDGHFGLITHDNVVYLIIVSHELNREVRPNYNLTIIAADAGTPPLSASKSIMLTLSDVNDNEPVFLKTLYRADVNETAPNGTFVTQVSATDADVGENARITYRIVDSPDDHSDWFHIGTLSGLITTRGKIDCEVDSQPQFKVVAMDSGTPSMMSTATVMVAVHDVNDNKPVFAHSLYQAEIAEDKAINSCILQVNATDPDCGVNGQIRYYISNQTSSPIEDLTMNERTGQICVKKELDFEKVQVYDFPIIAVDSGNLDTTAQVQIRITDVNDNHPIFYPREWNKNIDKATSPGTNVISVRATDRDSGSYGTVTYSIISGNENSMFTINTGTGVISLVKTLPQQEHLYTLYVRATDNGGLQSEQSAIVRISVTDAQPPVFDRPLYRFSVQENVDTGFEVGTVHASLADGSSSGVRYSIMSGDPQSFFSIHPTTGVITTQKLLDHDEFPTLLLNIQAEPLVGNNPVYGTTQANITIEDVNDNAPVFSNSHIITSVAENMDSTVTIYVAHATDKDSHANGNGEIRYRIQPASSVFQINPTGGEVRIAAGQELDYELVKEYELTIVAYDQGTPSKSSNMQLTIKVLDSNDNSPVFTQSVFQAFIIENKPVNTPVFQVNASDADTDENGRITFSLLPTPNYEKFGIFPSSGIIYLKEQLDREDISQYTLTVSCRDHGHLYNTATTQVIVHVQDANDNHPIFSSTEYTFNIKENMPSDTSVGIVMATDDDDGVNALLQYSLVSSSDYIPFIIDNNGLIKTIEILDRETMEAYDLIVRVQDSGTSPKEQTVSVRVVVQDVNDNQPVIVNSENSKVVDENRAKGTQVEQIRATDPDAGANGEFTFSLFQDSEDPTALDFFTIDPKSGWITTKEVLDFESKKVFKFIVIVRDGGSPSMTTSYKFTVMVKDTNDEAPEFATQNVTFYVVENVPIGTTVGQVEAYDRDAGENGRVSYYIVGGNTFQLFAVNTETGHIYTMRDIDYEEASDHMVSIKAMDNSVYNRKSSMISVKINIIDINDNSPSFTNDPIFLRVKENTNVSRVIHTLTAIDRDSGVNGTVIYSATSDWSDYVHVNQRTGEMSVIRNIDYEECKTMYLVVSATDQCPTAECRRHTTITVMIVIQDENDNSPVFISDTSFECLESEPIGYKIVSLIAVDADSNVNNSRNNVLSYSIVSGNNEDKFQLHPTTGVLTIAHGLDRETTANYSLRISAQDHGSPQRISYMNLNIKVLDVNDNAPAFEKSTYQANVSEDSVVGSVVTAVRATDLDAGQNGLLRFRIPEGIADDKFTIDPTSGIVKTRAALDRESKSSYVITVYVQDSGDQVRFDMATLIVNVTDVNDNSPIFKEKVYNFEIPENTDQQSIHTFAAHDADTGNNATLTYTLAHRFGKFSINPVTGDLSCTALDRETVSSYDLTITVSDQGTQPRSDNCRVLITVRDQNDNDPAFIKGSYSKHLYENVNISTSVLTVSAYDPDEGSNGVVSYALNNNTDAGLFRIHNETGVIITSGQFDREKKATYTFDVIASDGGQYDRRSERVRVDIIIDDINDNSPVFQQLPYSKNVTQGTAANQYVLTVVAEDKDSGTNGQVVYNLASNYFKIEQSTGRILTSQMLTGAAINYHNLQVIATDQGNPPRSSTGVVEITVGTATPHTLRFTNQNYSTSLEEFPVPSTPVKTVYVEYSGNGTVQFSFADGNDNNAFDINSIGLQGKIIVKNPEAVDYEKTHNMRLIVAATVDNFVAYATVWIALEDINDNNPKFTQDRYVSSVWEEQARNTFVTQVMATDADSGANKDITYNIIDGNTDNAFVIDPPFSGIVKTNLVIDYEIRTFYKLEIEAIDNGSPPLRDKCILKISVVDTNDNPPTFPPTSPVNISEGTEVGTTITMVTANDVDQSPSVTYNFSVGGNPDNAFSVDRFSGKIRLVKPLDHEQWTHYAIGLQASDGKHSDFTTLNVYVTDDNDNAPEFTQQSYQVTVDELTDADISVLTVHANDADSGNNAAVTYKLGLTPSDEFYVDSSSGVIYTKKRVEYRPNQEMVQLIVIAEDGGSPSLSGVVAVQIQITSVNRYPPRFVHESYSAEVPEDTARGTLIKQVTATDDDRPGANKDIDYSIIAGNSDRIFGIDQKLGRIILNKKLDREVTSQYNLVIMAKDRGKKPRSSNVELRVIVEDVNDQVPYFEQRNYYVTLGEDYQSEKVFLVVKAQDKDSGNNSKVSYFITSGNEDGIFITNPQSGEMYIFTNQHLDYERAQSHQLVVRAQDCSGCPSGTKPLYNITTVHINVTDVNEFTPKFPVVMYLETCPENQKSGYSVFQAYANDGDAGEFGMVSYRMSGPNTFSINQNTGWIIANKEFDYETELKLEYSFNVTATDNGGLSMTVPVIIQVGDVDEYAPKFLQTEYSFTVPGKAGKGMIIGFVNATDEDRGKAGRVFFTIKSSYDDYFGINATTGVIYVLHDLMSDVQPSAGARRKKRAVRVDSVSLRITAGSGLDDSQFTEVYADLTVDRSCDGCEAPPPVSPSPQGDSSVVIIVVVTVISVVIIAVLVLVIIYFLRCRQRGKSPPSSEIQVYDADEFDNLPTPRQFQGAHISPYHSRLQYSSHTGNHNITGSDISDHSHNSGSSGRGSAEEDEDEEIRMINSSSYLNNSNGFRKAMPDSGIQDVDDNSERSVQNCQDYLARLGIDTAKIDQKAKITRSVESMHQFSDEGGGEGDGMDINSIDYNKLATSVTIDEDLTLDKNKNIGFHEPEPHMVGSLSSVINSEEEYSGSYNWDYLLDWGPQYQPLAHVFAEIARLKDDTLQPKKQPVQTVPQRPIPTNLNPNVRTVPPPIITNAPPKALVQPRSNHSSHSGSSSQSMSARTSTMNTSLPSMPRSPISHESSFTSPALTPSFTPSLSPLATRSSSISPTVSGPVVGSSNHSSGHNTPRVRTIQNGKYNFSSSSSEQELRI